MITYKFKLIARIKDTVLSELTKTVNDILGREELSLVHTIGVFEIKVARKLNDKELEAVRKHIEEETKRTVKRLESVSVVLTDDTELVH